MIHSTRWSLRAARAAAIAITSLTAACGGGGGGGGSSTPPPPTTFTIGGNVSGLASGATVVLSDNGTDNLSVTGNGAFTFKTAVSSGGAYAVTVATQPTGQTCTVASGSGTAMANVTTVAVTCTTIPPNSFTIGGNVSGLASGASVVLQDNGGDNKTVSANGAFTFATFITTGQPYAVTVLTQPTGQTCSVNQGSGTVNGANVTNVAVTCTSGFTIGGTVSGLLTGDTLVMQDNGGDNLTLTANGTFTFATGVMANQPYAVTVLTQPSTPAEVCHVSNGSGTATAAVTSITVFCGKVGQVVAVTDKLDGTISTYAIDSTTGALTANAGNPVSIPATDNRPTTAVIGDVGDSSATLYVGEYGSLQVSQYDLDLSAGNVGSLTFRHDYSATQTQPSLLALTPSNAHLYAAGGVSNVGSIFAFDVTASSGNLSALPAGNQNGGISNTVTSISIDPSGTFMFATVPSHFIYGYQIGSDGTLSATAQTMTNPITISPTGNGSGPAGTAVWPKGTATGGGFFYVSTYTNTQPNGYVWSYKYDGTGALTATAGAPVSAGVDTRGIAIDPTGSYLYVANYADGTISAFSINQTTGDLTSVGPDVATKSGITPPNATIGPVSLAWDPSGQWLYCTNYLDASVSVFTADSTGALTLKGTVAAGTAGTSSTTSGTLGLAVY